MVGHVWGQGGSLLAASVPWHALPCSTHIFHKHLKKESTEKVLLFSHRQCNPMLPAQAGGAVGNTQGGMLSLDFSNTALTGLWSLVSRNLAIAEDFDCLGSLSSWTIPQFPNSAADSVQHHASVWTQKGVKALGLRNISQKTEKRLKQIFQHLFLFEPQQSLCLRCSQLFLHSHGTPRGSSQTHSLHSPCCLKLSFCYSLCAIF